MKAQPRAGTFAYLPPLTDQEIRQQIEYIFAQGWMIGLEFSSQISAADTYWHWEKLPYFETRDPDFIMQEIQRMRQEYPRHYIMLTSYDHKRQSQNLSFLVHAPG
ncbi:MAG: ribulose bisphosphate carboxylase small subunit [Anaerolineae bacterium]|nr:MAG: ribulose bisphosphate carboxylase small subunit [Anaerolineae bacterium]